MITTQTIEQRVTQLEAELERLSRLVQPNGPSPLGSKQQQAIGDQATPPEPNWIDQLAGSITNEPLFLQALEYGKQHRQDS
jgi:hypothetical protein